MPGRRSFRNRHRARLALESGFPALIAQLDAALAARGAGRGAEPELATPRPGGVLSGLQTLAEVG